MTEAMRRPLRLARFGKDERDTTWVRNSCEELEEFFIDYHKMSGKKYRVLDVRDRRKRCGGFGTASKQRADCRVSALRKEGHSMNSNYVDAQPRGQRWVLPILFVALLLPVSSCSHRCVGTSCVDFGQPKPAAKVMPSKLTFGNQTQGSASAGQTVALSNTGQATLFIGSIIVSGDFTEENTCGASLGSSQGCTITVAFAPTTTGTLTGQLTIADNDPTGSQVVNLTGMGIAAPAALPAAERRIYVANFATNQVRVLDRTDWHTVADVQVGKGPAGLGLAPDGERLYVSNFADGTVSVIDTASAKVANTLRVGENPSGIAVSADGANVWVANVGSNSVSRIDVRSGAVVNTVETGVRPRGIAVTEDGTWVYVTNSGDASVWKIESATGRVAAKVAVGQTPMSAALGPGGEFAFVANADSASVSVISVAKDSVLATVPVGVNPVAVMASGDERSVFVVNQNFMRGTGSVTVLDGERLTVMRTVAVGGNPLGIGTLSDAILYVSNYSDGTISEVELGAGTMRATHNVGASPVAIALSPEH